MDVGGHHRQAPLKWPATRADFRGQLTPESVCPRAEATFGLAAGRLNLPAVANCWLDLFSTPRRSLRVGYAFRLSSECQGGTGDSRPNFHASRTPASPYHGYEARP